MDLKLNIKEISNLLVHIESTFDVNKIKFKEVHLWPIFRAYLYGTLLSNFNTKDEVNETSYPIPIWKSFVNRITHLKATKQAINAIPLPNSCDFLFLSRNCDHSDKKNGLLYSRHTDPYFELFKSKFKCLKLQISEPSNNYIDSVFIPYWFTQVQTRKVKLNKISSSIVKDITNKCLGSHKCNQTVSYLTNRITNILNTSKILRRILKSIKPKAVFLVCYHDEQSASMILACKSLKIPTFEIQHGQQGIFNALYCRWTNIPEKSGYHMMPDFIWMWGDESKKNYLKDRKKINSHPIPIVGGNKWLSDNLVSNKGPNMKLRDLVKDKIVVTIATQPNSNLKKLIPEFIYDVINSSPINYIWLIKLHPNQLEKVEDIFKYFSQRIDFVNVLSYEVLEFSLYDILTVTKFLITKWSSVSYESKVFNNIPVIVSETGKELFSSKINDGSFLYANDKFSLTKILNFVPEVPIDKNPYIQIDNQTCCRAMNTIENLVFNTDTSYKPFVYKN